VQRTLRFLPLVSLQREDQPMGFRPRRRATSVPACRRASAEALESRVLLAVQLVKDLVPGTLGGQPRMLTALDDRLLFFTQGPQPGVGVTDGTEAGTTLVYSGYVSTTGNSLTREGSSVFFGGEGELWRTDGTAAGTTVVKVLDPTGAQNPKSITASGGVVYFSARHPWFGEELWRTDGTPDGTVVVRDINPGSSSSSPANLTDVNGTLFFIANAPGQSFPALWKSDGTEAGTVLVKDYGTSQSSDAASHFTAVGDTLFFSAVDGALGLDLWRCDGTADGTFRLTDVRPGALDSVEGLSSFLPLGDVLLFTARGADNTPGLWRSDGTVAGTFQIAGLPQTAVDVAPGQLIAGGPSLAYFTSRNELWKTDGTSQGTALVQALPTGSSSNMISAGGRFYFAGTDSAGEELWTSDGTAAGTSRLADIDPGPGPSFPIYFTESNGRVYFAAQDAAHGRELWAIDIPVAAPAAPSALTAVPASGNEVDLSWSDNSDNEAAFLLERSATEDFGTVAESVKLPAGVTHYRDAGLAPASTYFYRARAVNRAGESTVARASAATPAAPAAPTGLTAVTVSHARVDLAWTDNAPDETGFVIERSPLSTFATLDATFNVGPDVRSFSATTVVPERHYFYRVAAAGPAARSAPSAAHAMTPARPPSNLQVWAESPNLVELQWDNPQAANPFFVRFERALPGEDYFGIGDAPPTTVRKFDSERRPGTTYRYRVRTSGPFGLSVAGDEVAVTTPPPSDAELVKDLNTSPLYTASEPSAVVVMNGVGYFSAYDDVHGRELWRTDGTEAGTRLVVDLAPGLAGGMPEVSGNAPQMAVLNGALYFVGNDGSHGFELFRTDGTEAGTVLVGDTAPGSAGILPNWLTTVGGSLFFVGGVNDRELWKSDGTASGTTLVKDIAPGATFPWPGNFVGLNGVLYFTATEPATGVELWRSDGTAAGTYRLTDTVPGPSNSSFDLGPTGLTSVGDTLFFAALSPEAGRELWKTDGTVAGTGMVADIRPGTATAEPQGLFPFAGGVLFSAFDATSGEELWFSDGTAGGTRRVADIRSGSNGSSPYGFARLGDKAYFLAYDSPFHGLYETDGTTEGTRLVRRFSGIPEAQPRILALNGALYFIEREGGYRLWKSDGTAAGTLPLSSPFPFFSKDRELAAVGDVVVFPAFEPTVSGAGNEMWRSDGTVEGTGLLKDIRTANRSSNPANVTAFKGRVYFTTAADTGVGAGLWQSDGTDAGTLLVRAGPASRLTVAGDTLYFVASDPSTGDELWATDGTAAGTAPVKDLTPGAAGTTFRTFTAGASRLYFTGFTGDTSNLQLWSSDGTPAGTALVTSSVAYTPVDPAGSMPLAVGDTLYFRGRAPGSATGVELWRTDGTAAGTAELKDVAPGEFSGNPLWLTNVNGTIYFVASDPNGTALWKSDGTEAGTVKVIQSPSILPPITQLTAAGSTLYFVATDAAAGAELWKSDGTEAGTARVADLWPGAGGSSPAFLTNVGGTLYFTASDPSHGMGLWKTDGTPAGTQRIRPVYGPLASNPFQMFAAGGKAFFTDAGYLWQSDGTARGTVQVLRFDDTPAEAAALGSPAAYSGGALYVRGSDPERGRELRRIQVEAPAPPSVAGVFVSGSAWSPAFGQFLRDRGLGAAGFGYAVPAGAAQLDALPWINLDRISIRFDGPVKLDAADLHVRGVNVADYALDPAAFTYDPSTRTATWRLAAGAVFGADRLTLELDADGVAGAPFRFRVNVLPGDTTRDGSVLADDYSAVKKKFFKDTTDTTAGDTSYSPFHDVNGDGVILAFDFSEVKKRFFNTLPQASAAASLRTDSVTSSLLRSDVFVP
jgi:ELWxxDGT repeat protein